MLMQINNDGDVTNYKISNEETETIKKFLNLFPLIETILDDHYCSINFVDEKEIKEF